MKKIIKITIMLVFIALMYYSIPFQLNYGSCEPQITLKILTIQDANSLTLGNETSPIPTTGIPFTLKVVLEGHVTDLMSYQVGITFDYPAINCTGAWIPTNDQKFIFYGKISLSVKDVGKGTVNVGATLLDPSQAVTTEGGLLCMLNFTANKKGSFTLSFYDTEHTMLLNSLGLDILPFDKMQKQNFTLNVIGAKSPPVASFTFSPTQIKANKTVTFDASLSYDPDGQIVSYIWDFGDGQNLTTTENVTKHKFAKSGIYKVNLTVVDNDNLMSSIAKTVMVGIPPKIIVEIPNTPPFEPNHEITFNASLSYDPDGQIVSYIWDFGDGQNLTTTENYVVHSYEKRGVYQFALKVIDDDGLANSTSIKIQIGRPPVANFTFDPPNPKVWDTVKFDASKSHSDEAPITSFVWYFEDTRENVTSESPFIEHVFVSADPGYNVTLTVYDSDGLSSFCSLLVPVTAEVAQESAFGTETLAAIVIVIIIVVALVIHKIKSPKEEVLEI